MDLVVDGVELIAELGTGLDVSRSVRLRCLKLLDRGRSCWLEI